MGYRRQAPAPTPKLKRTGMLALRPPRDVADSKEVYELRLQRWQAMNGDWKEDWLATRAEVPALEEEVLRKRQG